jgi:hypothetical protein
MHFHIDSLVLIFFFIIVMMSPDLYVDSDVLEGPSRVSLSCPIRYCVALFMEYDLLNIVCCEILCI